MSQIGNRRELFEWAVAGAAMTFCASGMAGEEERQPRPMLQRGDRLDLAGREEEALERAYRFGYDYEKRFRENVIEIDDIDALADTPVLDLKP